MELEIKNKALPAGRQGLTVVELIEATAIFAVVMVIVTTITLSILDGQRNAFALQDSQESGRYILETMSKEIRMSKINSADSAGLAVDILNIKNMREEDVTYKFSGGRVMRNGQPISPDNTTVIGGFYIRKVSNFRSVITIVMKIETSGDKTEQETEINLQSTISARPY